MKRISLKSRKMKNGKIISCEICDYYTSKKSDLVKHKNTRKHQRKQQEQANLDFLATDNFVCEHCGERFKSRTTAWRHKKKCTLYPNFEEKHVRYFGQKNDKNGKKILAISETNLEIKSKNNENDRKQEKIMELLLTKLEKKEKQNEELWKAFQEQQTLLKTAIDQNSEIIPRIGNNNNNKISINVVLNEKCKNAMNLEDFLKKLQVSLDDLMYTKENGYVKGLSNIMAKHLNDLQPNDRPIHCSD